MINRFNRLIVDLYDEGADSIVAGGVASVLQGVERLTLDIEVLKNLIGEERS